MSERAMQQRQFIINGEQIIVKEEHLKHLGHRLLELKEHVKSKTMWRLQDYEAHTKQHFGLGALDTLFLIHWHSKSIKELARITHISLTSLLQIFNRLNLPRVSGIEALRRSLTPEQWSEARRKGAKAYQALLALEQRRENARKGAQAVNAKLTPEQRSEKARKARLANIITKPSGLEHQIITILKELGVYAERTLFATQGRVYHSDTLGNRRHIRLRSGNTVIPDFKVKGESKVIEVWGEYWHSREFCEPRGDPEYRWNATYLIEEYARVKYQCLVIREHELNDAVLREQVKRSIVLFLQM